MDKKPVSVLIEEVHTITIQQEKYDRMLRAQGKIEALASLFKFIPSYQLDEALDDFFGNKEKKTEAPMPASKAEPPTPAPKPAEQSLEKGAACGKPMTGPVGGTTIIGDDAVEIIRPPETAEATPDA